MCGIAGFSGNFPRALLGRMSRVQAHRGPDDKGEWYASEAHVGLSHRRLSIIDLSDAGHQPMWDPAKRALVVFNGEIYNYRELRRELGDSGCCFRTESDTEVLLQLYLREGRGFLEKINGIFAFALWDVEARELLLARDGLGVKPLYYAECPAGFLFASEIKSLLQEPSLSRALDIRAVRDHLSYIYCPGPRTMLEGVHKVMPGEVVRVREGNVVSRKRYWSLPFDQVLEPFSMDEAASCVREQIRTAVHRQMVSDVPVGAFLSGGLDSSAVVAFAREKVSGKFPCFTISFEGNDAGEGLTDDLPYAEKVSEHLGVDLHNLRITPKILERLDSMLWHLDEPLADPAAINVLLISEEARRSGIKVLLGGTGGDDLFTGYRRHYALNQEKFWAWLPQFARSSLRSLSAQLPSSNALARRVAKALAYADRSADERLLGHFRWVKPQHAEGLLAPTHRAKLVDDPFCEGIRKSLEDCPETGAGAERLQRMLHVEMSHFLVDHNLNYTDKMSMAVGVEARVPLLDADLVSLACRIPASLKQHGREGKAVFKKAMEGILPHDVIYRPKTGFGAPLRYWLRGELKPLVDELLSLTTVRNRGLFDPVAIQQLIADDLEGRVDAAYTIFGAMCIERWCQLFLDISPPLSGH